MTDLTIVVATLTVYLVVAISPGPNFALVSRLAMGSGRQAALAGSVGVAVAATSYAILTMAGLGVVLQQVGWLARGVQIAGGLYLTYLGLSAWFRHAPESGAAPGDGSSAKGLRAGLLVAFSNPKSIAFFVSLYAAAVPADTALWAKATIIAGGFAIELLWYGLVAVLLSSERSQRVYRLFATGIERAVGSLLAIFGLRMVLDR